MIDINLLPEELRQSAAGGGMRMDVPDRETLMPILIGAGAALALFLMPVVLDTLWLGPRQAAAEEEDAQLTQDIQKYNTTLSSLKALAENKEKLKTQLASLESVAEVETSWGAILNEMRALTPGNLWFDNLKTDAAKGTLEVSGAALDYASVAYLQRNLQNSRYFESPTLSKTELKAEDGRVTLVTFQLSVTVRKQGKANG